jgi:hypothetical protein
VEERRGGARGAAGRECRIPKMNVIKDCNINLYLYSYIYSYLHCTRKKISANANWRRLIYLSPVTTDTAANMIMNKNRIHFALNVYLSNHTIYIFPQLYEYMFVR